MRSPPTIVLTRAQQWIITRMREQWVLSWLQVDLVRERDR